MLLLLFFCWMCLCHYIYIYIYIYKHLLFQSHSKTIIVNSFDFNIHTNNDTMVSRMIMYADRINAQMCLLWVGRFYARMMSSDIASYASFQLISVSFVNWSSTSCNACNNAAPIGGKCSGFTNPFRMCFRPSSDVMQDSRSRSGPSMSTNVSSILTIPFACDTNSSLSTYVVRSSPVTPNTVIAFGSIVTNFANNFAPSISS